MKPQRLIQGFLSLIAVVYFFLLLLPQMLFAHKIEDQNFIVYHNLPDEEVKELPAILSEVNKLLDEHCPLEIRPKQKIFLCSSFAQFTFFAPTAREAFALQYPIIQNIFIAKAAVQNNQSTRKAKENATRTLSGVIAHETTHSLLENDLGIIRYKLLPAWKNEGYCDYIAQESSLSAELRNKAICNLESKDSPAAFYYLARKIAERLMKEEKSSDAFLNAAHSFEEELDQLRAISCP